MKTLTNHILLYDKDCPLCVWYTGIFIKYNLLQEKGRVAFQDIDQDKYTSIDYVKAMDKIALLNTENGNVLYGIDAISLMLSMPFPFIGVCMKFTPLHWFMTQVYSLISMNRKIIIPISCTKAASCSPSRSYLWRGLFILFCMILVNLIVGKYFTTHLQDFFIGNALYGDSIYFLVQLVFQYFMCMIFKERNTYDYLGQISFVSLLGAIMLGIFGIGLSILSSFHIQITMLQPFCYGIVFAFMYLEHRRRMKIAELDYRLTYTWLLIRIIMYPFAFIV